jgi:hypothetical protein
VCVCVCVCTSLARARTKRICSGAGAAHGSRKVWWNVASGCVADAPVHAHTDTHKHRHT